MATTFKNASSVELLNKGLISKAVAIRAEKLDITVKVTNSAYCFNPRYKRKMTWIGVDAIVPQNLLTNMQDGNTTIGEVVDGYASMIGVPREILMVWAVSKTVGGLYEIVPMDNLWNLHTSGFIYICPNDLEEYVGSEIELDDRNNANRCNDEKNYDYITHAAELAEKEISEYGKWHNSDFFDVEVNAVKEGFSPIVKLNRTSENGCFDEIVNESIDEFFAQLLSKSK